MVGFSEHDDEFSDSIEAKFLIIIIIIILS
jgi:hypothetical protein